MIRSKARLLLEQLSPLDSDMIKDCFNKRLKQLHIKDVVVSDVEVDIEGNIIVEFEGDDGDMDVIFHYDVEDGVTAIVEPDGLEDEDELTIVDLSDNSIGLLKTPYGLYPNLLNLEWLTKDIMRSILFAFDADDDSDVPYADDEIEEATKLVVRSGKKVRIKLVRRKRAKRLTPKQRQGLMRAKVKRKAKMSRTLRKRKKSVKLRKRGNLKTGGYSKSYKVAGTKSKRSGF
jgi:hypothetical protein